MTAINTWGTLGTVLFQFLTSPEYGTVSSSQRANWTTHSRIITRNIIGQLQGQKPRRQIAGLDLKTWRFKCKISALILSSLDVSLLAKLALQGGAGPFVGSALAKPEEDKRFYTDVKAFIDSLDEIHTTQSPELFFVGTELQGRYTLDGLEVARKDMPNGDVKSAEIDIALTEWID